MRIALLDSDRSQAEVINQTLLGEGHACQSIRNAKEALYLVQQEMVDLLVLDQPMSDPDIRSLLQAVREVRPAFPLLFLAARESEDEIAAAVGTGITDYLLKPIRRNELATRVNVLLRRAYPGRIAAEQLHFGPFAFDTGSSRITAAGKAIDLTQKEFELALLFFRNLGRPLSRAYILESVWSRDPDLPSRTMDTHVSRVRNKLGLRPENGFRLAPVYSYGYCLEQVAG